MVLSRGVWCAEGPISVGAGDSGRAAAVAAIALMLVALFGFVLASAAPARADEAPRAFLLGDSVLLGAAPTIQAEAAGHGWAVTVDARVGRTTLEGAALLRSVEQQLPSVVVIELGNNDGANPASFRNAIDNVMSALVGVRHVVWFTITPFASWVPAANAELRAAVHRWPNLRLADWGSVSVQTTGTLDGAGPHLLALGAQRYADVLFATLDDLDRTVPVVGSFSGSAPTFAMGAPAREAATAIASASVGTKLWFVTPGGQVLARIGTPSFGSLASPREPVVGIAATATGNGYWLVASDGGIFSFGDAHFYGSTGAIRLNQPIVGMSPTPTGHGYWLVASDGGIFSFGDAHFYGSTGSIRLNQPIVGMSPTPTGHGYWLVASDGGIFTFGDAHFYGSTGSIRLNQPIVGMSPTASGHGYWLVASDGGIFTFGDAHFYGSGVAFHAVTGASFIGIASEARGYELAGITNGGPN